MSSDIAPSMGGRLEVSGISVDLPSATGVHRILHDVDLAIEPGEVIGIVGRSGSGKTTLMRVLGGLQGVSSGRVSLDGESLSGPPRGVITVFQDYASALLPWRTVASNVGLGLERGFDRAQRAARVAEAISLVQLSGRERDLPWRLSGGMQQRVQIARALAVRPRVLLMDEPFGALDAMTRASLQDELLRLRDVTGVTVVFVTHDVDEAVYLSDRVIVVGGTPGGVVASVETGLGTERSHVDTPETEAFLHARHVLSVALTTERS